MSHARAVNRIVSIHLALVLTHGAAHLALGVVVPSWWANLYVLLVIWLAPLGAPPLVRRGRVRKGGLLLFCSMAGALLFGLWIHFVVPGPDHVGHVPGNVWGVLFQVTALGLLVSETVGAWIGHGAWSHARHVPRLESSTAAPFGKVR